MIRFMLFVDFTSENSPSEGSIHKAVFGSCHMT